MSTIYRDRDRYDDSRTSISTRRDGGNVTVKRYIVKDDDTRSSYRRDSDRRTFIPERSGERVEETRIVRRERDVDEPVREIRRDEPRYSSSELVIRRDTEEDDRRGSYYDRDRERSSDQELVIRRTTERDEPRYDDRRDYRVSETRYRDDYQVLSPTRGGFDDRDRDLTRYTRNTEYFAPAPPPQTIIIKQEPIIIRERARDEDYQVVRKSDVEEEKSVVRRERTPEPPKEEEYFYEKKVRERIDDRDDRDDWRERRSMRREVSPHDSVSQVGGRARSRRNSYSSDDSMVYVKRTKEEYSDDEGDSHKKRDAIAGALAGVGAAELFRNHKKKEGKDTSHGIGRLGRDVGAGALGVVAAEGIRRARSEYRSRSRKRRSRSRGRSDSRSRSRSRNRSRSGSHSKLKTWGTVGLGAAALAAAAAIAQKKMGNKEGSPDRGRDRSRSGSRGRTQSVAELANDPTADDARNPKHRNKRMAEVGAAGAAITALIEHHRSKSRPRDRSRSRVRQAIPVVAAGLGSAALAGLYEKNKAKKEAEVIAKDERKRSRSRSRARTESTYYDGPREGALSDPAMIEYGDGPMHGNNYGPGYYGRPAPQEGYYADTTAVVPAGAAPSPGYGAQQGAARGFSQERRSRSRSVSSSPGRNTRERQESMAANAAAAGAAAAAMSEHERKKQERRDRRARRREQEQYARNPDPYEDTYNPQYQQAADPYAAPQPGGFYPQTSQFPPPPGSMPQQQFQPAGAAPGGAPNAYGPQDFPPPPPGGPPPAGYNAYASGANPYAPHRGADENVSVPPPNHFAQDGLATSRSVDPEPSPEPPQINVHPPSISTPPPGSSSAQLKVPPSNAYVPPIDRSVSPPQTRDRASSQPPPLTTPRKSVQFAEKPEVSEAAPTESEASAPDRHRHRHHRDRTARGYEAGDDTDSTPDDMRRRSQRDRERGAERSLDPDGAVAGDENKKRRHQRRRSADPSSRGSSSRGDLGAPSSSSRHDVNREPSPADSDATVELPPRFDEKGKKKPENGDDPMADRIDEILQGRGTAGKLFGNFVDGLFGPDGRKKKG